MSLHSLILLAFLCISTLSVLGTFPFQYNARCKYDVIGFSSGGLMTDVMHTVFSSRINRVAIVAGQSFIYTEFPTFADALPYLFNAPALYGPYPIAFLINLTETLYADNLIDNPDKLKNDKVYIFAAALDAARENSNYLLDYYTNVVNNPSTQIKANISQVQCDHNWLTDDNYNNAISSNCLVSSPPYLADAGIDLAGDILRFFFGNIIPKKDFDDVNLNYLESFNITSYIPDGYTASTIDLDPIWYAYIPLKCRGNGRVKPSCKVEVILHGCLMSVSSIGDTFILHSGFLEYADRNNLVLVYPQMQASSTNFFLGCWDFWGYSQALLDVWLTRDNPRAATINNFVLSLMGCD